MTDFHAQLPAMLDFLRRLVETESPSHDKAAVDRVGAIVAEECRRLGAQVEIIPNASAGDHILARFSPQSDESASQKPILTLCHMDTVYPLGTLDKMPFYSKDDKTYGPGVLDMKGGIVITLFAIAALKEAGQLKRPITCLFTSDEEIGSNTSRAHIEHLARDAEVVLVLESGLLDGALKTWRKGVGDFVVRVWGRAAHSGGEHEKGRNAIEEMAHQVLAIQKLTDYSRGTTVNVGVIHGGIAENVVPDYVEARGDIRVLIPEEADRILTALKTLHPVTPDTRLEVSGELNRPPMPFDATMRAAFARARQIAANIGMDLKAGGSGGGSDANFVAPLGVPVLDGLGAVGADYHSEREWIYTASLAERTALVEALIREW
ncbi:MAG: M20 family metallopeptidase [Anaerolineales bacterium]